MKRLIKFALALLVVLGVSFVPHKVEASGYFDIDKHTVEMKVREDGTILVTETMDVHFFVSRHGIYVNIPKKYDMTWDINGIEQHKSYLFPLRNVKVLSAHDYEKTSFDEGIQIKIGSKHKYANTYETYKWQYEIVTRDLDLDGIQMLFMNIVSGNWKADTHFVEFSISMPKDFDRTKLQFDSPEGITGTSKGALTVAITANVINGNYNKTLKEGQALTVQLMLGDNYFSFADMNYYGILGCIMALAVTVIFSVLFSVFGKDDPLVETVEFHAPAGVTSAEVGVIIDGIANDGDVISLILDWGRRGVITIVEEEADGLKLVRNKELERAKNYERIVFDKLFAKGDEVYIEDLKEKFYKTILKAEKELDKYFSVKSRKLFTDISKSLQIAMAALSFLPICSAILIIYYNYSYDLTMSAIAAVIAGLCITVSAGIVCYMDDMRYMHKWYVKTLLYIVVTIAMLAASFILMYVTGLAKIHMVYALVTITMNIICLLAVREMKKRTEYGNQLLGQVLGLRNFILVAEQDRLVELLDENPYYFYDILPYAYALGLTDVWNEHFKNLTMAAPEWYVCSYHSNPYYMMHSLENHMAVMERSMTSAPVERSGGFSSSGGFGGFSGRGFGGSGGGSW